MKTLNMRILPVKASEEEIGERWQVIFELLFESTLKSLHKDSNLFRIFGQFSNKPEINDSKQKVV
jgi:hypothetical protein